MITLPIDLQLAEVPVAVPENLQYPFQDVHTAIYKLADAICNPEAWIAATYENSWASYGTPYGAAKYYKDITGRVWLKGVVASGTIGLAIFTLPAGYRPVEEEDFLQSRASNNVISVHITAAGVVYCPTGSNVYVSLSGINFLTK